MAGPDDDSHRRSLTNAASMLKTAPSIVTTLRQGRAEDVIADVVAQMPRAMLMMGAYGHSPLRTLIVGSSTTAMIRTVHVPVLLVR